MIRVYVLVEGDTEERFVKDALQPHFDQQQVCLHPINWRGIRKYRSAKRDMLATLKQYAGAFCTTMFDYYGMPPDWPGRKDAKQKPHAEKALMIENAMLEDISAHLGGNFNRSSFIPYVQMHEYEALLFSHPKVLAEGLKLRDESEVQQITGRFHSPEEINDSEQNAPSKRIQGLYAGYVKNIDGILIAQKIGLEIIRAQCPHFNEWISKLESLASHPQAGA